jgi:peptidoglycan/LPS O-acetylase OafA/YrhL
MLFDILRSPGTPDLPDYLYFGPCSALIILGLALLEAGGWLRVPRTLVYLGGASYAIYLVHFSVISLTVALLARLHLLPLNDATCLVVAGFGVIAGLGFDHLVDRPIQTALRRLKRRLGVPGNAKQPA